MKKEIIEWIITIIIAVILFFVIRMFLFITYSVEGDSMFPTLKDGDKLIINKIGYQLTEIEQGDVVVFHANDQDDYVKRIIATPGDTFKYEDDQLFVNDQKVSEPYLETLKSNVGGRVTENIEMKNIDGVEGQSKIPEDHYLVLGDNRINSKDSRHFGLIERDQIVGEVSLRYFPFDTFKYSFDPAK